MKSIVQEHNTNNHFQAVTPKKKGKVSLFKRMAEAQHNDSNQTLPNKKENNVPVMQNTIKENPNNTAMDENDIDFYFTQREVNIYNIYNFKMKKKKIIFLNIKLFFQLLLKYIIKKG